MNFNRNNLLAFAMLILATALYRVIPFDMRAGWLGAPQFAMAIFAGSVIKDKKWAFALPIFSMLMTDLDHDRKKDLITAGNFYGVSPYEGRYDANRGFIFRQQKAQTWSFLSPALSGFNNPGETRDMKIVRTKSGKLLVVARNNQSPGFFRLY